MEDEVEAANDVASVLIVNDQPMQLLALEAVLADLRHNLTRATSGREALRLLLKQEYAVILLDVNMPDMDGFETAALIRQRKSSETTPIIFLTAMTPDGTHMSRGYALGAVDYISTPIVPNVLKAKVAVFVDLFRKTEQVKRQVAELKRAEEEHARLTASVEEQRARLAAVMSSMSDGLFLVDPDQRVRYCNARAGELLGVEPEGLRGQRLNFVFGRIQANRPPPSPPRAETENEPDNPWELAWAKAAERPSFEFSVQDAIRRDLLVQLFPVSDGAGIATGVGVVLRDVTAERDLQRTKDEILSVVSHELRTPLASLVGFADLLLTREYDEARKRQFLTVIREEGHRLTALINDFLDLQRMERAHQEMLLLTHADPHQLLEHAVTSASDDGSHPIVLDAPDPLPLVRADADRIHQVLANLLSNARKYSPEPGEIKVSARRVDGAVEVSVQDHGLGIPPDALPRLFEKFYRVDNSDRRNITGTGLGLAICRQIIAAHGGHIWAESAGVGQGARLSFTLPLAERSRTNGDVLVVENDAGFARLLEAELATRGLTGTIVQTAEAGLKEVATSPPRAVLLDLLLPGMQGEGFLAGLREKGLGHVPVVVVTIKELREPERLALAREGVTSILRKGPGVAAAAAEAAAQVIQSAEATTQMEAV